VFVLPLGLVCLLLLGSFFLRNRWLSLVALALLYTSSLPPTGRFLVGLTEGGQARLSPEKAPSADAIVVLSGGRGVAPGPDKISEWHDADRFFGGLELFAAGKAPILVFTGGAAPWEPSAPTEGEILRRYAAEWGVPGSAIKVTDAVFNTQDEAKAVVRLMSAGVRNGLEPEARRPKVLLVTSAFHMPRARAVFEAEGLSTEPFAVDFLSSAARTFDVTDLLPSPQALSLTTLALREFLGRMTVRAF
jgi:uncharacterized SAM-binding protein YcdF (DUF218 family)